MVKLPRIQVLFLFVNPAPIWGGERAGSLENEPETHRGNTPWWVSIPALGITVQAENADGEPICGYWDLGEAEDWGVGLFNAVTKDPVLLERLRKNPEAPLGVENHSKIMARTIWVVDPEVA